MGEGLGTPPTWLQRLRGEREKTCTMSSLAWARRTLAKGAKQGLLYCSFFLPACPACLPRLQVARFIITWLHTLALATLFSFVAACMHIRPVTNVAPPC